MDRLDLHKELVELLGNDNVYFQPPASIKLKYPCIIYSLNDIRIMNADNKIYKKNRQYSVILIHPDPDNDLIDKFMDAGFYFDRSYIADGLHHFSFRKYLK